MILLTPKIPPVAADVNPGLQVPSSYIQIGLETGQHSWEMDINCPNPELLDQTHYLFRGNLSSAAAQTLARIRNIAETGREQGLETFVVYEAGAFGQKLGRDIKALGCQPVQLAARNIEYVQFGVRQQNVAKTDRIDSQRQANLPLDHPDLPYADVKQEQEEALRDLAKEKGRLEKRVKAINSQMCSIFRTWHIDAKHGAVSTWKKRLNKSSKLPFTKIYSLNNLLSELTETTTKLKSTQEMLCRLAKEVSDTWQPPDPAAQPAEPGRHPLQALGENSPLRDKSLPKALQEVKGIGLQTMLMILALVGNPRRFKNKKAFRAFMGLVPTPYQSCTIRKSLGMKRGNPKLRCLMIQLAWRWCRMHPGTPLAKKYQHKLNGSRRSKKIAVCALAGELAEMLYSYLVHGKQIPGLSLKENP